MQLVIIILSIIVGIKTASYGIFEISKNNNKFGGIFIIVLAIICAITPNIIVFLKGIWKKSRF